MNGQMDAPILSHEDDMRILPNIDYNSLINDLMVNREKSPIVQPTNYKVTCSLLSSELPKDATPIDEVIQEVRSVIDSYSLRITHPGFFGYLVPSPSTVDPLGHVMATCINQNICGFITSPAGTAIERTVINWLIDLVGMPNDVADGVLFSGGSLSNFTALSVALASYFGPAYQKEGLISLHKKAQPTIICSSAAHFSIQTAASLMGVGSNYVIEVDVDSNYRTDLTVLEKTLKVNKNTFCVVATAGTTVAGAIDPLLKIAEICRKHKVWLHVDAAYGGGVLMSEELRHLLKGIELADSVTIDLHKWFYCSYDVSALLYRDSSTAKHLFFQNPEYMNSEINPPPESQFYFHMSPEVSRRFRALPVYITIRHYGVRKLGKNVLYSVQCAQYLAHLIDREPDLELICRPQLSIVNFRYTPDSLAERDADILNSSICNELQLEGNFFLSPATINKRPVLRCALLGHSTRSHHVKNLIDDILRLGRRILETSKGSNLQDQKIDKMRKFALFATK